MNMICLEESLAHQMKPPTDKKASANPGETKTSPCYLQAHVRTLIFGRLWERIARIYVIERIFGYSDGLRASKYAIRHESQKGDHHLEEHVLHVASCARNLGRAVEDGGRRKVKDDVDLQGALQQCGSLQQNP
jgi:hypothetical protein